MKTRSLLALAIAAVALFGAVFQSASAQQITVNERDLPPEVLAKLKSQQKVEQVTQTLSTGKEWAEIGRAIGIATREGLSAVSDETAKFAETTPGKFTMALIAWKVAGADLKKFVSGVIVGIPFLIFWLCLYVWWLRKVYGQRKMRKIIEPTDAGGKREVTIEYLPPLSIVFSKSTDEGGWGDNAWVPVIIPNILFIAVSFIITGWLVI